MMDCCRRQQNTVRSNVRFFTGPRGIAKLFRFILITPSFIVFLLALGDGLYVVVTAIELAEVLFFIIVYLLTLDKKLKCVRWSRVDFLNCLVAGVIVGIVCIVAIASQFNDMVVAAGVLGLIEAFICFVEAHYHFKLKPFRNR